MSTRTVPVSSTELDSAIEVLASAGQALRLSRFERISYRTLVTSADIALASMTTFVLICIAFVFDNDFEAIWIYLLIVAIISAASRICRLLEQSARPTHRPVPPRTT